MGKTIEEHMQDDRDERQLHREVYEASRKQSRILDQSMDEAMIVAEHTYGVLRDQADPYAMHKAVEQIPSRILARILNHQLEEQARIDKLNEIAKHIREQTGDPIEGKDLIHVKFSS